MCRGTDISKCFRESLGLRDNESTVYIVKSVLLHACVSRTDGFEANNVYPDQTPHVSASDLDLHCLTRPVCPNA